MRIFFKELLAAVEKMHNEVLKRQELTIEKISNNLTV